MLKIGGSGIGVLQVANVILMFAVVGFYWHAYWYNTIDLSLYRLRLSLPTISTLWKYVYVNSFFMFGISTAVLVTSIVIRFAEVETRVIDYSLLALSVVLALVALRLLTLREITHWRRRPN